MNEVAARAAPIVDPTSKTKPAIFPTVQARRKVCSLGLSMDEVLMRDLVGLSHTRRLPGCGLRSSMLSMDVALDREETIDLGEFNYLENPCAGIVSARIESAVPKKVTELEQAGMELGSL